MAQNLQLDPKTGDYVIVDGRPVGDPSLKTPAYIRSKVNRTKWLYAPDTSFGSDYYLYKKRHSPSDDQAIVAATKRALQPLIDSGRAVSVDAQKVSSFRNNMSVGATIQEAGGLETELTFSPITN